MKNLPYKSIFRRFVFVLLFTSLFLVLIPHFNFSEKQGKVLGAGTPALISHSTGAASSCGATASATINTTGATLLVITVGEYGRDPGTETVSDSNGNTWRHLTGQVDNIINGAASGIWYAYDKGGNSLVTGAGNTFTVTGSCVSIEVSAWSGTLTGSDPFDVENGSKGAVTQPGNITPSQSGELIITAMADNWLGGGWTVDSGFSLLDTVLQINAQNVISSVAYLVQTNAGPINPTWTPSAPVSSGRAITVAAFKPSTGSGGGGGSAPTISSFSASPGTVSSGGSSTLSWLTTGATSVSITSIGSVSSSGSSTVSPSVTTTYTLTATNSSGSVTANSTVTVSGVSDTTAPVISSISSSGITSSSASINWNTNENSDSQVEYGLTTGYGSSSSLNASLVSSHSVSLSSLSASTVYHYRVKSRDGAGNLAISTDNTFTTSAVVSGGGSGGTVTWTKMSQTSGWPGWVAWLVIPYDAVSQQSMFYGAGQNYTGIYSTRMNFYNSSTNIFTDIGGTSSTLNACPADTLTQPGDRHPDAQMTIDTKRNVLWMYGGVNASCGQGFVNTNGTSVTLLSGTNWTFPTSGQITNQIFNINGTNYTVASVQDSTHLTLTTSAGVQSNKSFYVLSGSEANPRQDTYYLSLNANPSSNTWHQVTTAHFPSANSSSALVYDPDDDVLFAFGSNYNHAHWLYCPTSGNPSPGVLTSKQSTAGCTSPDDWSEITPTGGVQPASIFWPGLVYDTVTHKVILYGGTSSDSVTQSNQTWAYDVPTRTWTQKALSTTPPPIYNGSLGVGQPAMVYNTLTHKIIVHQFVNTGAPADWQYDPVADTWTKLTSVGGGPSQASPSSTAGYTYMGYDAKNNLLVTYSQNASTGGVDIWQGSLGAGGGGGDTTAPSTPSSLTTSNISSTAVTVSWVASTDNVGVSYYTIYRNGSPIGSPSSTSFTDTGLTANTSYSYTVSATDTSGNASSQSSAKSATTLAGAGDTTAPSTPTGLSASAVSSSQINVTWTASTDAVGVTGYKVYRNGTQVATSPTNSYSDGGLSASTQYSYTVSAYDAAGNNSAQSSATSGTTQGIISGGGSLITPLTIQEAIYPGSVPGITRSQDPLSVGIPLAQNANITNVSQLGLSGASLGQFRVLGCWSGTPTPATQATSCGGGAIKWVQIDTEADITAGGQNNSISLTTGSGNFGGSNLATDNGATITVNTGSAQFTIKKANFNVIDQAIVNGKTVVATGASQGLVLTGPNPTAGYPGNVTCSPNPEGSACTTVYSSVNDVNSTCSIEENGPVKAVLKCIGDHKDSAGNVYMHYTLREYFYKNKSSLKVTSILRNADYGTSNTFNSAYKGFDGYELRLGANISGTLNYTIANESGTPTTGSMSGSDDVYLYQGESKLMQFEDNTLTTPPTTDQGFTIVKNGSVLRSGSNVQSPQGWCDVRDSAGAGIEIGLYQMAGNYPKSCEFAGGGSDVRIGISPKQNSQAYYAEWPQWEINDMYINFHDTALATPANEFLKFQHYLLARAPYTYYNTTAVFPNTLVNPAIEDSFASGVFTSAVPAIQNGSAWAVGSNTTAQDFGTVSTNWPLNFVTSFSWNLESEYRDGYMMNFLTRGMTGRWLEAANFYRFQSEYMLEHSDGFDWRNKGAPGSAEIDGFGKPRAVSANNSLGPHPDHNGGWRDQEHAHWYGQTDYYFMTGDETIKQAMIDEQKDWFVLPNSYQDGAAGGLYNSRSIATQLLGVAKFADFLESIGDPDYTAVNQQGINLFNTQVKPDLCVSGYPQGCSFGSIGNPGSWTGSGVSRTRGIPWGSSGGSGNWCGLQNFYRVNSTFQASILAESLLTLRSHLGPSWSDYWTASDLAYGIAQWALSEGFVDDGTGRWDTNGFRFGVALDVVNNCDTASDRWTVNTNGTSVTNLGSKPFRTDGQWYPGYSNFFGIGLFTINGVGYTIQNVADANHLTLTSSAGVQNGANTIYVEQNFLPEGTLTTYPLFVAKYATDGKTDWVTKLKISMQKSMVASGLAYRDVIGYQMVEAINIANNPTSPVLTTVPLSMTDLGGGTYRLSWTVPASAQSYRIKWGNKAIVDWIGFNPGTNQFIGNPNTTMNWFAATNATNIPAPTSPGSTQTFTISTGVTGLSASNFSVKAYIVGGSQQTPTVPTISSFSSSPSIITSGGSSTLSFSVSNATSLSIDQSVGSVTGLSSKSISPTQTTTYTLTATNSSGSATAQTTVTVNLAPDTTAPTISLTSPTSNQTISGSITLSASGSDPTVSGQVTSGLFQTSLLVDGSVVTTSSTGSVTKSLDTTTLTNGTHTITARAQDNAGNITTTSSITITVNNISLIKFPRLVTLTSLEGILSILSTQQITVTVLSGSTVLETQSNLLPILGKYTVSFLSTDPQLVNIRVKALGYLSQLFSNIDTTQNSSTPLSTPTLTAGDFNNDNVINSLDFSLMNSHWNQNFSQTDVNTDGLVNSIDFGVLKNNFGKVGL